MKQQLLLIALIFSIICNAQFSVGANIGYSVKAKYPTAGIHIGYKYNALILESGMVAQVPFRVGAFFQQKAGIEAGHFSLYTGGSYHYFRAENSKEQPPDGWHVITGVKYKHIILYQECYECPPQAPGYWGIELSQDGKYTFASLIAGVTF